MPAQDWILPRATGSAWTGATSARLASRCGTAALAGRDGLAATPRRTGAALASRELSRAQAQAEEATAEVLCVENSNTGLERRIRRRADWRESVEGRSGAVPYLRSPKRLAVARAERRPTPVPGWVCSAAGNRSSSGGAAGPGRPGRWLVRRRISSRFEGFRREGFRGRRVWRMCRFEMRFRLVLDLTRRGRGVVVWVGGCACFFSSLFYKKVAGLSKDVRYEKKKKSQCLLITFQIQCFSYILLLYMYFTFGYALLLLTLQHMM
jgi:hypothetical protein